MSIVRCPICGTKTRKISEEIYYCPNHGRLTDNMEEWYKEDIEYVK